MLHVRAVPHARFQVVVVFQAWFEALAFSLPCASSSSPEVAAALDTFGGDGWEAVENILQGQRVRTSAGLGVEAGVGAEWQGTGGAERRHSDRMSTESLGRVGVGIGAGVAFGIGTGGVTEGEGASGSHKRPAMEGGVEFIGVREAGSSKRPAWGGGGVGVAEFRGGGSSRHGGGVGVMAGGGSRRRSTMGGSVGGSSDGAGGEEQSAMRMDGRRSSDRATAAGQWPARTDVRGGSLDGGGGGAQSLRAGGRWSPEGAGVRGEHRSPSVGARSSYDGGGSFDQSARMRVERFLDGGRNGDQPVEMHLGGHADGIRDVKQAAGVEEGVVGGGIGQAMGGHGGAVGVGFGQARPRVRVRVRDAPAKHRAISEFLRRVLAVAVGAADGRLTSAPEFLKSALFDENLSAGTRLRELGEAVGYYHEVMIF